MKSKKFYTSECVRGYIISALSCGATHQSFRDEYGVNTEVIEKTGRKTMVFKFYGTHTDGRGLYTLRQYNATPKKYLQA